MASPARHASTSSHGNDPEYAPGGSLKHRLSWASLVYKGLAQTRSGMTSITPLHLGLSTNPKKKTVNRSLPLFFSPPAHVVVGPLLESGACGARALLSITSCRRRTSVPSTRLAP